MEIGSQDLANCLRLKPELYKINIVTSENLSSNKLSQIPIKTIPFTSIGMGFNP